MDSPTQDPTAPGTASSTSTKTNSRIDPEPVTDDESPSQAFHHAQMRLSELAEYVGYFISAKVDGIKLTVRNVAIFAALGIVGLIAAGGMVVTSVVLLCYGIARGLGVLFGGRIWLGD